MHFHTSEPSNEVPPLTALYGSHSIRGKSNELTKKGSATISDTMWISKVKRKDATMMCCREAQYLHCIL